jgi:acetyl esterase/lipase
VEAALRDVPSAPTPAEGATLAFTVEHGVRYAPGDGRRHVLDVYRPSGASRGAPVLVQLPGGAWVTGDRSIQARPLMRRLASHGWVCVAANYRLSPRATFPDHLVDVKRVLAWVRSHAADLGADPDFIAITGGSAGAHLAALAALTPNQPEYQPGFEEADTTVQACVPFYGIYDFTNRAGRIGGDGMGGFVERVVMKRRIADAPEVFRQASPICLVRPDAPPFAVVHGINDSFARVEDARAFASELRATSRARVILVELPVAQHAFDVFPTPRTRSVVAGVEQFLDAALADARGSRRGRSG